MERKLLVIEDDPDIAHLIELSMQDMGFKVDHCINGQEGLERCSNGEYDFLILDLMLPSLGGVEICKELRSRGLDIPIIMLTAKAAELDKIIGLEAGADDYITKPFSISELQARVKARLRRRDGEYAGSEGSAESADGNISIGNISIDREKRRVTVEGEEVVLTAKEFDLLFQMASNPGKVYTRDQLLDSVWGYGFDGYDHTVNSHINRLRSKVEKDAGNPDYVLTVWGVGYKFAEPGDFN